MIGFKHFSFDLWMTLIKSNPSFKKRRAGFFFNNFNPLKKTIGEVELVFRDIDLMCNAVNEKTGQNIDAEEMYLMVLYKLAGSSETVNEVDIDGLYGQMEQLVLENMPLLYSKETMDVLGKIKADNENTLSILSNTAFIKGATLRTVLKHLQIDSYFDFQLYSDEVGISKPNKKIFEMMLEQITLLRKDNPVQPRQIIHTGDNITADITAANTAGINSFQINSNDKLITDLFS